MTINAENELRFDAKQIHIGASISAAQEITGINSVKMAEDYGVSKQQISRWRNAKDMHLSKVKEFAKYFGIEFFDFIELGIPSEDVNPMGCKPALDACKLNPGASIRAALKEKKLSIIDMASEYGVARQQTHRWVSADDMKVSKAIAFADYFGIEFFAFLELSQRLN